MSAPREIKLEIPTDILPRLVNGALLNELAGSASKPATSLSTYFDTNDFKLRENHLSLQVRRVGRQFVQSIKEENHASTAPLFNGATWEHEIGVGHPDRDAARRTPLAPLLRKKSWHKLKPLFEERVQRKAFQVKVGNTTLKSASTGASFKQAGNPRRCANWG